MKLKALEVLTLILLLASAIAAGNLSQLIPISINVAQDVPADSAHNIDTLTATEMEQQAFQPSQDQGIIPHAPPLEKIKKPWPTGALFRSAIIPGWGQVYNKQYVKAVIYGGAEIALAYTTVHYWKQMDSHQKNFMNSTDRTYQAQEYFYYQNSRDNRNLFLWLTGLTFFVSIFDAYVDAHFADFNEHDKAFEAYLAPKNHGLYLSLNFALK